MKIFAGYAQDINQPLSKTYLGCATQIDGTCGPGFADVNIKVGSVDKESQKNGAAPAAAFFKPTKMPLGILGSAVVGAAMVLSTLSTFVVW